MEATEKYFIHTLASSYDSLVMNGSRRDNSIFLKLIRKTLDDKRTEQKNLTLRLHKHPNESNKSNIGKKTS